MAQIIVNVPEGVHIKVSRVSEKAIDLPELVFSHVLLSIRACFGREARFEWVDPQDWVRFCSGEKAVVHITGAKQTTHATVYHGENRVVYVKQAM